LLNCLFLLLTSGNPVFCIANIVIELIQTMIHIPPLACCVPILVSDIVNIPFQIGLAPFQLL